MSSRIGLGQYISPHDIQQGSLGDCYFLSTLSSIAAVDPSAILKLFLTRTINPAGIYAVKICDAGIWRCIYVDDQIPCYNKNSGPCFTRSAGKEIWVLLLEKVWAKIYGSYERIEGGNCREVLRDMTGAPT